MTKVQLQQIITLLSEALIDAEKFDSTNDAAGRRLRAICQDAKNQLHQLRLDIQTERNSRKS